jgi:sec-independent protein translocase protein TatA
MPFGIQPIHIILIIIVALLLFGPKRLPEMGRSIGKAINEFRNGTREMTDSLRAEVTGSGDAGETHKAVPGTPAGQTPAQSVPYQAASLAPALAGNFCIQCGAPNLTEARFCNQCGTKLPENTIKPSGLPS